METKHTCETCRFFAVGLIPDFAAKTARCKARPFTTGGICTIRPPMADKTPAVTDKTRICALWTDLQTGAQPYRYALPEIFHPLTNANGKD